MLYRSGQWNQVQVNFLAQCMLQSSRIKTGSASALSGSLSRNWKSDTKANTTSSSCTPVGSVHAKEILIAYDLVILLPAGRTNYPLPALVQPGGVTLQVTPPQEACALTSRYLLQSRRLEHTAHLVLQNPICLHHQEMREFDVRVKLGYDPSIG